MADTKTTTKYEDRLRELNEQAESEPWQIRPYLDVGSRRTGYQVLRLADDELSYKRLATTTPTEDRWLPGSEANVNLMTFQRNSAEKVAELVEAVRARRAWEKRWEDWETRRDMESVHYGSNLSGELTMEMYALRDDAKATRIALDAALAALDQEAQR